MFERIVVSGTVKIGLCVLIVVLAAALAWGLLGDSGSERDGAVRSTGSGREVQSTTPSGGEAEMREPNEASGVESLRQRSLR